VHLYFITGQFLSVFTFIGIILYLTLVLSNINFVGALNAPLLSDIQPKVSDPNLNVELVFQDEIKHKANTLSPISSMTFLGNNDILLLEKNNGTINRILNGVLLKEPLLDVSVANKRERGMLGIATTTSSTIDADGNNDTTTYVFLYYTRSEKSDGTDVCRKTYY